ncbi:MAG TPA: helix-turn-helix domain-containing protein, partial [Puia sp.]|nr:helix-turn-helix domain-containing protein [Puia sp.]
NVRELINVLERSFIQSDGPVLNLSWNLADAELTVETDSSSLGDIERAHILKILKDSRWKINGDDGAAIKLGLHPNTLRSRLKKLQIERGKNI